MVAIQWPSALSAQTGPTPADAAAPKPTPTAAEVAGEEVVKLDAFNVTTTIGTYHEDVSSMATKVPTELKELASSLQILNASAISDRNALALPDIFAYVVGATQSQSAVNGFSFRGFPNTGTFTQNIEFDGLIGATLKKGASSAADVDNLEFLKGPNGVLYGQMHPGGLLNIVTKSPKEVHEETLRLSFGTYAGKYSDFGSKFLGSAMIDLTGPIDHAKHWLYRVVVDASTNPPSRPGDYDKYISVYPSLTYQWNNETYLTVKVESSMDRRRQDDGLVPIFTDGTAYGSQAGWYVAPLNTVYQDTKDLARDRGDSLATYFHARLPGDWVFRFQTRSVWHTDFTHEFTVNNAGVYTPKAPFATPASTFTRQYNLQINGHRYNFFDANLYHVFGPEKFQNTVLIGTGGGEEFSNNSRFGFGPNVGPAIAIVRPVLNQSAYPADGTGLQSQRNTLTNFGEYISDQLKIGSRLHATIGGRNDQQISHGIDVFVPTKTPYAHQHVKSVTGQFGLVFDVTRQVSTYASWSQSVVPNSVTSVDATGNSSFAPEKGLQYETGVKFETPTRDFFATFAAYYINRSNVLVATGTTVPVSGQGIFRLDGQQHSEGVEMETEYQPKPYWQLQAGVALGKAFVAQSFKNPQTVGLDLTSAPRGSGNFWSRFNVPSGTLKGLGFGTGVIYVGKSWAGDPTTALYYVVPGWTRVDLASYYHWKRFDLTLNLQNIFDRQYIASAQSAITLTPGEARKCTLSIITHF
jgi:iron complex outermembrane receptor protein